MHLFWWSTKDSLFFILAWWLLAFLCPRKMKVIFSIPSNAGILLTLIWAGRNRRLNLLCLFGKKGRRLYRFHLKFIAP